MRPKLIVALFVTAALGAAACSSSSKAATSNQPATSATAATTTTVALGGPYNRPACTRKPASAVTATRVAGSTSDYDLVSFDGTKIRVHWFPLPTTGDKTAPTVLKGRVGDHPAT